MKKYLPLLLLLIFFRTSAQTGDSLLTKVLTPTEMQTDFKYLRRLLEETHPGLYRYTSKMQMQAKMDSIYQLIQQHMGFYDFYRTIEGFIADIRCAHTHSLPFKNWVSYYSNRMKTLPFFFFPIQNRSYVLFNGTYDQRIQPGFELISINGKSMESIRKDIYRYHWDDGFIESSKSVALQGQLFGLFYYTCIDRPDTFQLAFRDLQGDTVHLTTPAQTFVNHQKAYIKNPVNKQMLKWYNTKRPKKPWRLSFIKDLSTAYLRFDSFSGEGAKTGEEARERFRRFMDVSMAKIQQKKTHYLIVDVRSNYGGWDTQGVELFTYLMKSDSAVRYYQRLHSITDSSEFFKYSGLSSDDLKNIKKELQSEKDGTFTLKENENPDLQLQSPKPNRFRGKVYILIDGRSFSTTTEFTAVTHSNKVGTFVGEETGGAYEGGNGSSFIHLELPNSKIQVGTPLVYYQNAVHQPKQKGRGTLPDYTVPITLESLLQHKDVQLEFVKELIKKGNN
jgi:hypothetical protein